MKNTKGITLIALVITIIILIILAGVSINLVMGQDGIITKAQKAREDYQHAAGNEQKMLNEITTVIDRNMGNLLVDKVQIGDYVAYDATNSYSYESPKGTGPSHGNGDSAQTFTSSSSIKWRVLSKNTETGEIVLISEAPINTDANTTFNIKGAIGYLYTEEELNRICAIYGHGVGANTTKTFTCKTGDLVEGLDTVTLTGSGARSINVDDINNITGYTPSTGTSYTHSIFYPTKTTETGYSASAVSRIDTTTVYSYAGSTYLTDTTSSMYQMLFRDVANTNNISYFLASRSVLSNFSSSAYFRVRLVGSGYVGDNDFGNGDSSAFIGNSVRYRVRPVVYLQSNIQTSGQDASGAWKIN